jgi:hypothetical protein
MSWGMNLNDALAMGNQVLVPGKLGQAAEVKTDSSQGIVNYMTVTDPNGDLSFAETNSFTVALWLKFTGAFNDLPIIGNANNSTYNAGWVLSEDGGRFEWTAVASIPVRS